MTLPHRLSITLLISLSPLLIPFFAMMASAEVNWSFFDFVVAAILLLSTGMSIEFITRKVKKPLHRLTLVAGAVMLLLLLWIELAVGLFGSPLAGS